MAQRTEKEDSEFINKPIVPESPLPLCVNGFTSSSTTTNNATSSSSSSSSVSLNQTSTTSSSSSSRSAFSATAEDQRSRSDANGPIATPSIAAVVRREVNRCAGCRRKVGLTGFRCRCGDVFCGEHRYSDRHGCCFDYKAAGREAIERENPVVKAAKILRI